MKTLFTKSQLVDLKKSGKIRDYKINDRKPKTKKQVIPKGDCKEVAKMHWWLKVWCQERGYELKKDHKFHDVRMWKLDFAIMELKIGIEYEGLMSEKSRHTTLVGYSDDATKYNEAQQLGWKVFRYTVINYKQVLQDLDHYLNTGVNAP